VAAPYQAPVLLVAPAPARQLSIPRVVFGSLLTAGAIPLLVYGGLYFDQGVSSHNVQRYESKNLALLDISLGGLMFLGGAAALSGGIKLLIDMFLRRIVTTEAVLVSSRKSRAPRMEGLDPALLPGGFGASAVVRY
jgi:hypothetical protein